MCGLHSSINISHSEPIELDWVMAYSCRTYSLLKEQLKISFFRLAVSGDVFSAFSARVSRAFYGLELHRQRVPSRLVRRSNFGM